MVPLLFPKESAARLAWEELRVLVAKVIVEGLPCEGADLKRLTALGLAKLRVEGVKGGLRVRLLSRLNLRATTILAATVELVDKVALYRARLRALGARRV